MNTDQNLFAGFAPVTKEQWKLQAMAETGSVPFDNLLWHTDEGFTVQPLYTAEDMEGLEDQYTDLAAAERRWKNYVEVAVTTDEDAGNLAVAMKQNGAEGILFQIADAGPHHFPVLLKGIDPQETEISFGLAHHPADFFLAYLYYLEDRGLRSDRVKGFFSYDILRHWSVTGDKPDFGELARLLIESQPYHGLKCLVTGSHEFVNAGCNVTQELAFTLHKLSQYIQLMHEEGITVAEVMDELVLHIATGSDYFMEIAKLRALKILLEEIQEFYGCETMAIPIISSSTDWNKTYYEPNLNLLRNTSEAMAAVIGGCDALMIRAHDACFSTPSAFSSRIALNTGNLLRFESYFDKVADPAAGSYYIENLTRMLVVHTRELFRKIEAEGGYIRAFEKGIIQEAIRGTREKKVEEIAAGKRVFVGTNRYPDGNDLRIAQGSADGDPSLLPQLRATVAAEAKRSNENKLLQAKPII